MNLDGQKGRKIILKLIPIIIYVRIWSAASTKISRYCLTDLNPRPNNLPLTNVLAVNIVKHSDNDTEPDCFVRLRNFYISWTVKTSPVALYCMELQKAKHRHNVRAVLTVGIIWSISGQCRHQTDNTTPLDCLRPMSAHWQHSNSTVFAKIDIILSIVMSSWIPNRKIITGRN
jgi:hypothetical protein